MISSKRHRYLDDYTDLIHGDVLTVRSTAWYNENKTSSGLVFVASNQETFNDYMASYAGRKVTVNHVYFGPRNNTITIMEDGERWNWHTWMFEEFEFPHVEMANTL